PCPEGPGETKRAGSLGGGSRPSVCDLVGAWSEAPARGGSGGGRREAGAAPERAAPCEREPLWGEHPPTSKRSWPSDLRPTWPLGCRNTSWALARERELRE